MPTLVILVDLITIVFNLLQFLKASFPIEVIFLLTVIVFIFLFPLNALSLILVTLYVTFLPLTVTLTVAGTETDAFLLPFAATYATVFLELFVTSYFCPETVTLSPFCISYSLSDSPALIFCGF